jgi:predicted DNA-binding transcriptional regulator AlpA
MNPAKHTVTGTVDSHKAIAATTNTTPALVSPPSSPQTSPPLSTDPNRLIRVKEVLTLIPVTMSTWYAWVASGRAPQPIRLGARCTCWRYSDVVALASADRDQAA